MPDLADGYYWVDLKDGEGLRIVQITTVATFRKAEEGEVGHPTQLVFALVQGPPIQTVLFIGTDLDAELSDYDSVEGIEWIPVRFPEA